MSAVADRDDLLRRDVHQLDLVGRHGADLGGGAEEDVALELQLRGPSSAGAPAGERRTRTRSSVKRAVGVERRVGLGDDVLLLLVGGEVDDLVGDLAVGDLAVRRLDEAELVDPGEGREARR